MGVGVRVRVRVRVRVSIPSYYTSSHTCSEGMTVSEHSSNLLLTV